MDNFYNPNTIDREIKVNPSLSLMVKFNVEGIIEYVNHSFSEISGYEEFEIIGESVEVLRHPDMPKVIYQMLTEKLENKEPIRVINKMLAKDGRFFWVVSDYESKLNEEGEIIAYYNHSMAAVSYTVHKIDSLYKILSNIEAKTAKVDISKKYLKGFLEERNLTYDKFIDELCSDRGGFEDTHFQPQEFPKAQLHRAMQEPAAPPVKKPVAPSNVASDETSNAKPKKQKSLLKKVFGK